MHPALQAFLDSLKVAAGSGPFHHGLLFWALLSSALTLVVTLAAGDAPWQNIALVPGMLAGLLWLGVFFQVAHHSADSLFAFVGGLFLIGFFIALVMRVLRILRLLEG